MSKQGSINLNTDEALNCKINIIKIQERIYIVWINLLELEIEARLGWKAEDAEESWMGEKNASKYANKNLI